MSREAAVLLTLVGYKLALVGIGLYYHRKTQDGVDFFLAGRRLGPMVAAISASASSSSAWTLLGVSGAAYAWGLSAVWIFPSCVGGFLLNWYILAPALQRMSRERNALTVTEMMAGPRGEPYRDLLARVASIIILVSLGTYVSSQFQAAGKTFSETFGISIESSILLGAAVVVFYTMLGGFWAVSVTDTLQGLLMALTAVLLPAVALIAVGGPAELSARLAEVSDSSFWSLTQNLPPVAGLGFILGILGIGIGYPGQPHVVNRFMALEDRKGALIRARRIAVAWALVVYSGMLILGFCGRALIPGLADREVVFIAVANEYFHPVVAGVMLAAVLSAIMSTADSQLLVASSSVTYDLNWKSSDPRSLLFRSRVVTLVLSAGAALGALYGSQEIFSQVLFAWSAMGCAFGPLLLVTVFGARVREKARLAAMVLGFGLSVVAYYAFAGAQWSGALERVLPFLVALAVCLWGARKAGHP